MKAVPDQLVTYFFWAEDIGPDGKPRRTSGDMFFAEVRHFEEIFRQGEQPPSGSAENEEQAGQRATPRQADQLAELQKQIINGTWKLIRRETGGEADRRRSPRTPRSCAESQQAAIEQAAPARRAAARRGIEGQPRAGDVKLDEGRREAPRPTRPTNRRSPRSTPALAAEQAAYQALLKLRAREFEVIRSNSRQQPQAAGARQQPLAAAAPAARAHQRGKPLRRAAHRPRPARTRPSASASRRENRQVLNRLRELAQRQSDLNERLKELQSALEAAKTQQAREEIERQLKRLRDQQQQILRDTDELRERMETRGEPRADGRGPPAGRAEPRARPPGVRGARAGPAPAGPHRRGPRRPAIQRPPRRAAQGDRPTGSPRK